MASKECSYELRRYLMTGFAKCKSAVAEEMKKILEARWLFHKCESTVTYFQFSKLLFVDRKLRMYLVQMRRQLPMIWRS